MVRFSFRETDHTFSFDCVTDWYYFVQKYRKSQFFEAQKRSLLPFITPHTPENQ